MYPAGFKGRAIRLDDLDIARTGRLIGVGEDELRAVIEVETAGGGGYVLSPIIVTLAGLLAGWGVGYDAVTGVLTIHVESAVTAIFAGLGISGAIFAKWGVR